MRIATALVSLALGVVAVSPALAQQPVAAPRQPLDVEITRPLEERPARVVPPPLHYETTRPPDADFHLHGTKVEHDPAFIEPLAAEYETATGSGRVGLSGWTAPNTPVAGAAANWREVNGWFAIGFSVTWGGPPAPRARPR
jgi:hypothetical protein